MLDGERERLTGLLAVLVRGAGAMSFENDLSFRSELSQLDELCDSPSLSVLVSLLAK